MAEEVIRQADLLFYVLAPIRVVQLVAIIAALVFMFLPAANDYFRRASSQDYRRMQLRVQRY